MDHYSSFIFFSIIPIYPSHITPMYTPLQDFMGLLQSVLVSKKAHFNAFLPTYRGPKTQTFDWGLEGLGFGPENPNF